MKARVRKHRREKRLGQIGYGKAYLRRIMAMLIEDAHKICGLRDDRILDEPVT